MPDTTLKDIALALEQSIELEARYKDLRAQSQALDNALSAIQAERHTLALLIAGFLVRKVPTLAGGLDVAIKEAQSVWLASAKVRQ